MFFDKQILFFVFTGGRRLCYTAVWKGMDMKHVLQGAAAVLLCLLLAVCTVCAAVPPNSSGLPLEQQVRICRTLLDAAKQLDGWQQAGLPRRRLLLEQAGLPTLRSCIDGTSQAQNLPLEDGWQALCRGEGMGLFLAGADGRLWYWEFCTSGGRPLLVRAGASCGGARPQVEQLIAQPIRQWSFTEKGNFLYQLDKEYENHEDWHFLVRGQPCPEEWMQLAQRWVEPVGYNLNNLFLEQWSGDDLSALALNDVFDGLYQLETGGLYTASRPDPSLGAAGGGWVDAGAFEQLVCRYLPVQPEQLHELAGWDAQRNAYPWYEWPMMHTGYLPACVPDVRNVQVRADGALVLTVDAMDIQNMDDCVFTHQLVLRLEDGRAVYLENTLLCGSPPAYTPRAAVQRTE